jgi:hypothetical protein
MYLKQFDKSQNYICMNIVHTYWLWREIEISNKHSFVFEQGTYFLKITQAIE